MRRTWACCSSSCRSPRCSPPSRAMPPRSPRRSRARGRGRRSSTGTPPGGPRAGRSSTGPSRPGLRQPRRARRTSRASACASLASVRRGFDPMTSRVGRNHRLPLCQLGHRLPSRHIVRGTHVRMHQLLGYILPGWGHVHFAETVAGHYRNPLRRGALSPYREINTPIVDAISAERLDGHVLQSVGTTVSGTIGLIADAYVLPSIEPPAPWNRARLVPSLVRWRLVPDDGDPPTPWRTAADFRFSLLPASRY